MSLDHVSSCELMQSFPRVSGDEPHTPCVEVRLAQFSPRERG